MNTTIIHRGLPMADLEQVGLNGHEFYNLWL